MVIFSLVNEYFSSKGRSCLQFSPAQSLFLNSLVNGCGDNSVDFKSACSIKCRTSSAEVKITLQVLFVSVTMLLRPFNLTFKTSNTSKGKFLVNEILNGFLPFGCCLILLIAVLFHCLISLFDILNGCAKKYLILLSSSSVCFQF